MKRAVSVSLGSSARDKRVELELGGEKMIVERIGTDGDVDKYRKLFGELDGKVDAFGVGGVDLYLRFEGKEWPLRSVLKILDHVKETPLCDGRGLKHTLERRVFELALPQFGGELPHFKRAFIPVAVDRLGLSAAVSEVTDEVVYGDLMVALGLPLPVYGIKNFRRVVRVMMPMVSYFPLSIIFYGSSGEEPKPKYVKYWEMCDLIAGDFLFMRKYMPESIAGKTIITNTTTADNLELLRQRGARMVITTTPRYDGRSFGTNMMEAVLTAYAGKGRNLTDDELNALIDELDLRPTVDIFEE
jgi:hypothetical protein